MLHWLHSSHKGLKGRGMCAATCWMWWLVCCGSNPVAGSLTKQPSERVAGTCSTGAALVSPWKNSTLWHWNKNKPSCAPMVVEVVGPLPPAIFSQALCIFAGQPPLTNLQSKHCSVNTGLKRGKHRFVVMCVVNDHVWTFLILSLWCYFFSCRVTCFEKPGPPPRPHLLSHDKQTNGFHCRSQWPLTSGLWVALQRGAVLEAFLVQ